MIRFLFPCFGGTIIPCFGGPVRGTGIFKIFILTPGKHTTHSRPRSHTRHTAYHAAIRTHSLTPPTPTLTSPPGTRTHLTKQPMRHTPGSPSGSGPTPHGMHSKRSKHAIREGDRSKQKRGGSSNRGGRPSYDVRRILDASPPPKHCLREPAPHRMRHSHAHERSEARHSPRRVVEERDGHTAASIFKIFILTNLLTPVFSHLLRSPFACRDRAARENVRPSRHSASELGHSASFCNQRPAGGKPLH